MPLDGARAGLGSGHTPVLLGIQWLDVHAACPGRAPHLCSAPQAMYRSRVTSASTPPPA
jgi:hypothetical protein